MILERKSNRRDEAVRFCYGGWDRNLEPGVRYGPVIRDTYVIECCTGGFGSAIINGVEFPVQAGDCYILLPGIRSSIPLTMLIPEAVCFALLTVCRSAAIWQKQVLHLKIRLYLKKHFRRFAGSLKSLFE